MNIFTYLRLSALVLCSFLFTPTHAQEEKDYFITVWDLSLGESKKTSIEFYSLTAGDVNYTWETIPAGQSGSGKFSASETEVTIPNLPVDKTIKLKLAPQNLRRFYFSFYYNPKLLNVSQWGNVVWSSMENAFKACSNLNISTIDLPNLSNLTTMKNMFSNCYKLNGPVNISQWNTQNVTDMSGVFAGTSIFNQPIGNWNTGSVTDMGNMFREATNFNQFIGNWNTGKVTGMNLMFYEATNFNQPIGNWNTGKVTDMERMFHYAKSFNQPIGNWNTEKVTQMSGIFYGDTSFNQPIGDWNTGSVISMTDIFSGATSFNQPIENWNTGSVLYMSGMFSGATSFNQPLGNWNTTGVTYMDGMFEGATNFNQPIGNWNTGNVIVLRSMFSRATSFNQPIGNWNTGSVDVWNYMFSGMLDSCGMDCKNYSYTLIGWANDPKTPTRDRFEFGAAGLKYSSLAQAARDILTKPVAQGGKGWKITGDKLSTEDCGVITSNQEAVEKSILSIYPNPAQDKLFLKNAPVNTAYKIIDGLGREVNAGTLQNEEISVATLPSGLYTLVCGNRHFSFVKE